MDESDIFMSVRIGLEDTPELTFGKIAERSYEALALVQMGRPELSWLVEPGLFGLCGRRVVNGSIVLLVPKPPVPEPTMTPHPGHGRQRDLLGHLGRDDDGLEPVVEETLKLIECNARLSERAAHEMNTATDVGSALSRLEAAEGVDLAAARKHHRRRRRETVVELAGHTNIFRALPVRVGVAGEEQPERRLILSRGKGTHTDFRAQPEVGAAGLFGDGFVKTRLQDFRVGPLEAWKRIVLEGARQLSLPVVISAAPIQSTWSLQNTRFEIERVVNWGDLLEEVVAVLLQAQAAQRKRAAR